MLHTRADTFEARDGAAAIAVEPDSAVITIPDAHFLFTADFKRKGPDLVLTGEDGRKILVPDYFRHEKQPDLASPEGALLSANLVELLSGSATPGQYAQIGTPPVPQPIGRVETLAGSASAVRNGIAIELNVGDLIFQSDVVQTRSDSTLAIAFSDGSAFTLNENARMVLNEFVYDPNSTSNLALINLVQGTVSFIAAQVAKTGTMRVETPTATLGIRGTFVTVAVSSVDGNTVASLGMETDSSGRQFAGAFTLTNRITGNQLTVSQVNSIYAVSPTGSISESAKPPAIAAIEAATFQALVPVVAAAANFGATTGPTQSPNQNPNQNPSQDNSSGQKTDTGPTNSSSPSPGGSSGPNPAPDNKPPADKPPTIVTLTSPGPADTPPASNPLNTPVPTNTPQNNTLPVTPPTDNTPHITPTGTVTNVGDTDTASSQAGSFDIMSQVSVANPGSPTTYVNGSATLVSASLSAGVPAALTNPAFLASLLSIGPDGTVHYDTSKFSFLAAGQSLSYTVAFDVQSGTDTLHLTLTFTVSGINEAPTITFLAGDAASATVVDDTHATVLHATGTLSFKDADGSDDHVVSVALKSGHSIGTFVAGVLVDTTGSDTTDPNVAGDIGWIFAPNKAQAQALAAGETDTEVYTITLSDGHGGTTSQDVSVTVVGVNDAPVVTSSDPHIQLTETITTGSSAPQSVSSSLTFTDPDLSDVSYTVSVLGVSTSGVTAGLPNAATLLTFLHSNGVSKTAGSSQGVISGIFTAPEKTFDYLAADEAVTLTYLVQFADANGGVGTQNVTVTVTGTNDVPVIGGVHTGAVTEDANVVAGKLSTAGVLTIADVDAGQSNFTAQAGTLGSNGYGTFSLAADGSWTYSADNSQSAIQQLGAGQSITDSFTAVSSDGSASQLVTVTINGTNDAPVIGGVHTGAVSEDVDVAAGKLATAGVLTIADLDAGQSNFTAQAGTLGSNGYGTFTLAADGSWTYSADNSQSAIQQLGAGQSITDSFTAVSSDGSASQLVTVTINGTNDAPVINGGPVSTSVQEDGTTKTSGQLTATDPDQTDTQTWTVVGGSSPHAPNYQFKIDEFKVVKTGTGAFTFDDQFSDNNPPPSAPALSYSVTGTFLEPGGHAIMDGSNAGFGTGSPAGDPFFGEYAILNTNIDPANTTLGLKNNSSFTVSGLFDLTLPQEDRNEYGIRLTDRTSFQAGDDVVELRLVRGTDGIVKMQLREIDFAAQTRTVLQSIDLNPGSHDQILLSLTNDVAHPGVVHASFELEQNGVLDAATLTNFSNTGTIFRNENWTRAQFFAEAPALSDSVLQGTYGQLDITQAGAWTYQLANGQANVQALAAGQTVQDIFIVQVADGHGGTDSKTVTVNVSGSNDAPAAVADVAAVTEDRQPNPVSGNVLADDTDVDSNDTHTVSALSGGTDNGTTITKAGTYGTLVITKATGAYTYTLANGQENVQALADGQQVTDVFTYTNSDNHGGSSSSTLTVTVTGTDEAPTSETDWIVATNGNWVDVDNWSNGVPSSTVAAVIAVSGAYTVSINSSTVQAYSLTMNAGTLSLTGGTIQAGQIDLGSGVTLEGHGTVSGPIDNSGLIKSFSAHTLDIVGNITGTGSIEVLNHTKLEIDGSVAATQTLSFEGGATGTLILDDSSNFSAIISGLGENEIDAKDLAFTGGSMTAFTSPLEDGNTSLVVSNISTNQSVTFTLLGPYTLSSWTFSDDGTGGTIFHDPPASDANATTVPASTSTDLALTVSAALTTQDGSADQFTFQDDGRSSTLADSTLVASADPSATDAATADATPDSAGETSPTETTDITLAGNTATSTQSTTTDSTPPATTTQTASTPPTAAAATGDTFVFAANFGNATITNFHPETDAIEIDHTVFTDFQALLAAAQDDGSGNAVITADPHDTITIKNVTVAQLVQHQGDFHFT